MTQITDIDPVRECERAQDLARLLGYPPSLVKACNDPFDYALGLRDGTVVEFESASPINREWVSIDGVKLVSWAVKIINDYEGYSLERGLDIRLSDIIWCADAPMGS